MRRKPSREVLLVLIAAICVLIAVIYVFYSVQALSRESHLLSTMFGNTQVGQEFIHSLNSDMWGSFFECPGNGYAKSISVYVEARDDSRLRCALYEEYIHFHPPPDTTKYMRFVMSTKEEVVPRGFKGWVKLNLSAPPPLKKGTTYWICAWSDEYGSIKIASSEGGTGIEWTTYMIGNPHGLGYPHFYEIVPQHRRGPILCSIYSVFDTEVPSIYECPYCGIQFPSYEETAEHIRSSPEEMIHLQICNMCRQVFHLEEELQNHLFEYHGIGSQPEFYSCIFCDFTASTAEEIYSHIESHHAPVIPEFNAFLLPMFLFGTLIASILARCIHK